ncbi:N-6 DNA Methylase [Xylanibacter ruminicola]|uniref:site-specific DNA-methyltransferase (adenine-specific) n=1 Tax=Xylanibacter ruminicola TaxID=839 RepID=A0A1H5WEB6_XYLRU|nr:N-6 DNA methylase [Xylanibacter ruminicola]SEF97521.1 N-6 DNA Methylase [Xylanibacter ruminicola]
MASNTKHSIEERVEDWCKQQFKGQKYYTKTESINSEIEDALRKAPSKKGGSGTNYPDIKCFIETNQMRRIPVMIEVKGKKGDFIKLDANGNIENKKKDNEPNYTNIAKYAVNGAVHYAHAILNFTESYKDVVAIGVNGFEIEGEFKKEIGVYYVSKDNLFVPKLVGDYSDLSFLLKENVEEFVRKVDELELTDEEIENKKLELEDDIERKLKTLNQKMHDELSIEVGSRVKLIAGLVMAGLGVPGKVAPLKAEDLNGEISEEDNDGAKVMRKIKSYLKEKRLPKEKIEMICNVLSVVFIHSKLAEPVNGESKLHTLYKDIKRDIMPFLTGELHNIDFTGRLFNVLNEWVDVPDGAENDVVLTPRYVTQMMARLCKVNMDSFVWDFATGSAGFLISAMNMMIADAKAKISSPAERDKKILKIKMEQLLGIEKLPDIYLLAVLNMILMQDGSANIIHADSLTQFEGNYEQGEHKGEPFPATVFLLNPPYSAAGKGFIFVRRALQMMNDQNRQGRAAVLIQENAGSGSGLPYTREILEKNTLLASIKMSDIFSGKASVQTAVYVFEVGTPHEVGSIVKFIDFSKDGYTRQNRKKSSQSVNLRDTDNAKERYDEVVRLVNHRGSVEGILNYFKGCYVEDTISPNGNDWTYSQHRKIDTRPAEEDFRQVVKDYLAWKVSEIMKQDGENCLGK